jgi:hypothetical protein
MTEEKPAATKRDVAAFLGTMRRRFTQDVADESEIREEAREDLRFLGGDQWDEQTRKEREDAQRPALTFNRLPTFTQQVANEARQNKPQVKFNPVDDTADPDTAEVIEGLARHIQYASKAGVAYETAVVYSSGCSFGFFRLLTEYCNDGRSFDDQEIRFAPVLDPFSVYGILIPRCLGQKPGHAFVVESVTREEYQRLYPKSELVSIGFDAGARIAGDWVGDRVRIAEYWYIEPHDRTLQLLSTGQMVYSDEYDQLAEGVTVERERKVTEDRVKFCKTNGVEILPDTETEWVGNSIPIYAVLGTQLIIDGKPLLFSLIRFMRDPQRLVNYYKSGIAEQIGLSNRTPYVGYKGQFKSPAWQNANKANYAFLEAEPVMIGGAVAPLPQRQRFEAPIQALSVAAAQEIDDLKSIAGIYDASLGNQGNETSGIAIQKRQQQSGLTNFHFLDNLARAQEEAGDDLGYMIPRVYDTARTIRILGEDETQRVVKVNTPYTDPETGKPVRYMLTAGKYDVTVSIGASYTTKRQEAADQTARVIQAAPQLMGVIGDVFFRNSDTAGADELADRVKKWINMQSPGLIEDDKKQAEIPPQVQTYLKQLEQQHQQLAQELDTLTEEVRTKKFELDSKERIEQMRLQLERERLNAEILLAHEKMGSQEAIVQLQAQLELIQAQITRQEALIGRGAAPGMPERPEAPQSPEMALPDQAQGQPQPAAAPSAPPPAGELGPEQQPQF